EKLLRGKQSHRNSAKDGRYQSAKLGNRRPLLRGHGLERLHQVRGELCRLFHNGVVLIPNNANDLNDVVVGDPQLRRGGLVPLPELLGQSYVLFPSPIGSAHSIRQTICRLEQTQERVSNANLRSSDAFQNSENVFPLPIQTLKRSEEHTSELQSRENLVCRLLLEKTQIIRDIAYIA